MVEWKKLGEVCSLKARIGWQGLTQKEHRTTGEYLLVTGTDFTSNYEVDFDHCVYVDKDRYTQDPNIQLKPNDVLITKDGTLGKMAVIENLPKPATLNGGLFVIRDLTGKLHHKYLLHYMLSSKFQNIIESNHTNGTIKHLTQALLTNFPIPIPTLIEQERIVDILDTFTSSIENLKQQIAQRRKQYEYYRDQLLDLEGKEGLEMKALGLICKLERGVRVVKKELQQEGVIPVYQNSLTPLGYYEKSNYPEKTPFVICAGAAGEIGYSNIPFWAADDCTCVLCPSSIIGKYIYFYLLVKQHSLKSQVRKASVPRLSKDVIGKLLIPVPPISEQQWIVDILDKFEASIQNLEAQLSQREKQYEYYRNKLLTF